jgi:lipopolysaccharide export system protein LptA
MSASGPRGSALALAATIALHGLTATAQVPDLAAQSALPIDLDAASSEFDRRNNRLVFREMHITQGTLSIRADVAEATRLDFENSRWKFRGNVTIDNPGTSVACDEAELVFLGHELRSASMEGTPARFEQRRPGGKRTEGRAGTIEYDIAGGKVSLARNAWLSDGANEVTGDRLTYDLRREYVTADSGAGGPVRMKINPPPRRDDGSAEKTP